MVATGEALENLAHEQRPRRAATFPGDAPYATRVIAVVAAAALTCVGALLLGQAACWVCGTRTWTFLAAPVGLAVLLLVSVTAIHVPGHASTVAVVLLLLVIAALVPIVREPRLRPSATDLLTAGPALLLVLLPFLANARAGTLGVSFNNDMESHLRWAEAIRSPAVAQVTGLDPSYPVGPHALCAVLAQALGVRVDYAFAGETMAVPVLMAWTTLTVLRRVGWPGKAFVATMAGLTFMVAGYYGQGSFKEIMQALFVLGFAIGLQDLVPGERGRPLRWVPLGLIVGGSLSVYSVTGLPWMLATLAAWIVVLGARRFIRGSSLRILFKGVREALLPALIAGGVLLVAIVPQLPRLVKFYENNAGTGAGTGIPTSSLGNLVGPVSFWKVFGMWDVGDYRLPAIDTFHVGMFVAIGLLVTLVGTVWWIRRSGLAVPLAAAVGTAIWIYSNRNQSPYVASKALVIVAPLFMLLATRWLVELRSGELWMSSTGALRVGAAALLGWAVLGTSVDALRSAEVGPTAHVDELRKLEPMLGRSETLFLGRDDFIEWELAGTPVRQPFLGYAQFPLRPQKAWLYGQVLDFDDIPPETLDTFRYVVGPRDPAASQPPSNMKPVRSTRYFEVWERTGPTPRRQTLAEGQNSGARLDCATSQGRALARTPGVAAVRSRSVEVPVAIMAPGESSTVRIPLSPGGWWLSAPYTSPHPIEARAPGLRTILPASLDRPGNRWLIGRIELTRREVVPVTLHVQDPRLAVPLPTEVGALVATRAQPVRVVPLSRACGQYVDWYRTS
jgi:hypothetical protein